MQKKVLNAEKQKSKEAEKKGKKRKKEKNLHLKYLYTLHLRLFASPRLKKPSSRLKNSQKVKKTLRL